MEITQPTDDGQAALWNGAAGRAWVEAQEELDRMFKPFENLLATAASTASGGRVLDVGCGTGGTTLAIARRLGDGGHCTGIDISEPMIAAARVRAESELVPASFILADAQVHAFEPAGFDMIVSRFGVMFFEDPVQAFANLRHAAKDDGELRFIAWRSPAENPFMTTAERAAAPLLPNIPARRPDAPGQFAFANAQRVLNILENSGWSGIDIQPIDVSCTLPEKELVPYLSRLGPVGRVLQEVDEGGRKEVIETVRAAFDSYVTGSAVHFVAACWMVNARATSTPQRR
ncbi:SAM-dependent methyltransferase [Paucibacter oligotrophus]|uniref:SAM-dependent methyltransferase n=1 Tax=Roseateles oligotrophus TaxID=1769250 RepID=A0A840L886_9BURK|nr:class I SAM-dependent methyltransferase [Roseateles oligotrophus]MBB4844400.1 SAM-dependent methyltransferase [Roseateles oligotrophus]